MPKIKLMPLSIFELCRGQIHYTNKRTLTDKYIHTHRHFLLEKWKIIQKRRNFRLHFAFKTEISMPYRLCICQKSISIAASRSQFKKNTVGKDGKFFVNTKWRPKLRFLF